jgi:hypothetical protein
MPYPHGSGRKGEPEKTRKIILTPSGTAGFPASFQRFCEDFFYVKMVVQSNADSSG